MGLLDPSYLLGIAVILRERFIDIHNVQVVPFGHSSGGESKLVDAYIHIPDSDAGSLYVGLP